MSTTELTQEEAGPQRCEDESCSHCFPPANLEPGTTRPIFFPTQETVAYYVVLKPFQPIRVEGAVDKELIERLRKEQRQQQKNLSKKLDREGKTKWKAGEADVTMNMLKELLSTISPIVDLFRTRWLKSVPPKSKLYRMVIELGTDGFCSLSTHDLCTMLDEQIDSQGVTGHVFKEVPAWRVNSTGQGIDFDFTTRTEWGPARKPRFLSPRYLEAPGRLLDDFTTTLTEGNDYHVSLLWAIRRIWFDWHIEKNFPNLDRAREVHGLPPKLGPSQAQELVSDAAKWVIIQMFSDFTSCLVYLWSDNTQLRTLPEKILQERGPEDVKEMCLVVQRLQGRVRAAEFDTLAQQACFLLQGKKRNANASIADFMVHRWGKHFRNSLCQVMKEDWRNRAITFALGLHPRVGADSLLWRYLDVDSFRTILQHFQVHESVDDEGNLVP